MIADKELINILEDKKSGSTKLALKLNRYFNAVSDKYENFSDAISIVRTGLGHFQIINYYLNNLEKAISEDNLNNFFSSFQKEINNSNKKIYANAKEDLLKLKSVVVISHSQTLAEVIKRWYKDNNSIKVIVLESRPKMEGRKLAAQIAKYGVETRLIIDSAAASYIKVSDAFISGADLVLMNGNIVNKTGTKAAAICCRHYNKPYYVFTSKYKFSNTDKYLPEAKNPDEVWRYKSDHLSIHNYYFEEIEKELITKVFTD